MPSTSTDQIQGISTSVALKAPCKVATTANITLSGEQTVNSVAVVAGDRVLVKDQTTASENGIWVVSTSAWTRAKDFDGSRDVVTGTRVPVYSGSGNYSEYAVSNIGSIVPGTTSLTFVLLVTNIGSDINANSLVLSSAATVGGALTASSSASVSGALTVSGNTSLNGGATLGDAAGDALRIGSTAVTLGGNLNIDSGTLVLDITNDRVGIGQATPTTRAEVNGTLYVNTGAMWINRASATAATAAAAVQLRIDGSASAYVGTPASGAIGFYNASATERMRLSATAGALQLGLSGAPAGKLEMNNASSDSIHCANFLTDGVAVFRVEVDGDVRNQNNSYGAISDAKFKENIADASPKLDKLNQVRIRTFNLKGSDLKQIGVVAQELREVFPSLVDEDADGTLAVKYSVLVRILVKAVQELSAMVAALEAR